MKRSEMRKAARAARAKRSVFGKFLCRLLGDEVGGVMMEYVVLGLLVAAAVVVAVMFFGKNIKLGFNAMGQATAGESKAAAKDVKESKKTADKGERKSEQHMNKIEDQ